MRFKEIQESTTSGSVASVAMPIGRTQKRAGSLFKGKKTSKPFYEDEIVEQDLILVPGQIQKKDKSFIPHDKDRRDHEVEMARSDLYAAAKDAMRVYKMIQNRSEDEGLMGWQQSYITLAADYLNSVADSLEHHAATEGAGVLAGGMSNFEEGAPELLKKEMPTHRHAEKLLAQNGVNKDDPDYHKHLANTISHLRKFGNIDQINKQDVAEGKCPKCGGPAFSEESIAEAKDACYHKVKSRYKVWPSAYASGALVKCRKVGASNWGNKSK